MIETRLPAHAEWIEALLAPEDATMLEAMELGEIVGEEAGRLVFGTDDLAGARAALRQMERGRAVAPSPRALRVASSVLTGRCW